MILSVEVIEQAAHKLLVMSLLDEKNNGLKVNERQIEQIANKIMIEERPQVMLVMGLLMGSIEQAWGYDIGLVFHHMGIIEDDEECATVLYRLIMSCFGHGIGIGDDHSEEFEMANRILSQWREPMEESPCYFDQHSSFSNQLLGEYMAPPELV